MLHSRDKRIEELIRQALSETIQFQTNDPRVPPIFTITGVNVSKDMRYAKIYYSQLPDDDESLDKTEEFLEDSKGYLRSQIAHQVNLKFTPELVFHYDRSQKDFDKINARLNEIKMKEKELGRTPESEEEE